MPVPANNTTDYHAYLYGLLCHPGASQGIFDMAMARQIIHGEPEIE